MGGQSWGAGKPPEPRLDPHFYKGTILQRNCRKMTIT